MSDEVKATAEAVVETAEAKKYSVEELQKQLKPLSNNGFVRFFQKIWRWWLAPPGFQHFTESVLLYRILGRRYNLAVHCNDVPALCVYGHIP